MRDFIAGRELIAESAVPVADIFFLACFLAFSCFLFFLSVSLSVYLFLSPSLSVSLSFSLIPLPTPRFWWSNLVNPFFYILPIFNPYLSFHYVTCPKLFQTFSSVLDVCEAETYTDFFNARCGSYIYPSLMIGFFPQQHGGGLS